MYMGLVDKLFIQEDMRRLRDSIRSMTDKFEHDTMYFDDRFIYFDENGKEHAIIYITGGYNPHVRVNDKLYMLMDLNYPMLTMLNGKIQRELENYG